MNTEQLRKLFPVTQEAVYLNSASQAPLNTLVNEKLQLQLNKEMIPIDKKRFDRNHTRILLSKLLGGSAEEYALLTSTGVGMNTIAQGLDLKAGDNIVLPEREHWNNTFPWLQLQQKGVEIRFVKLEADNSFSPTAFEKLVDKNTRLVAVAAVRFNSGFRPNLKAIGKIAHAHNALFMVDAAQAAGMIPIDVETIGIDIMAGCGFKWLLGMHGTGYMYVSKKVMNQINPVMPGMYAAEHNYDQLNFHQDARKFETGTIAYTLFESWSVGLELILEIGVENIYYHNLQLSDLVIEGLIQNGYNLISPTKNREDRTAIVHFNTGDLEKTKALFSKLKANNILLTLQAENIRVSPNFFNTEMDIQSFLDLL